MSPPQRPAKKRAGEIKECSHRDRLARRQNFGGNNRRDRIGRIVKAVDVFESDGCDTTMMNVSIAVASSRLRILQYDLEDDVPRVAATINHLFYQPEQIAQKNHLLGFVIALVKIA